MARVACNLRLYPELFFIRKKSSGYKLSTISEYTGHPRDGSAAVLHNVKWSVERMQLSKITPIKSTVILIRHNLDHDSSLVNKFSLSS